MSLEPGTAFGPYQIIGPLGAGGMGEVYRARDPKLERDVAIKTLPDAFANDALRLARFEREARTLASLNHPHIAQVYAIEGAAIVMELVEGEDLSQRIARGPVPLDEALPIARQIAEALEAAHEAGIIHRDLKPGNVKVRADGTVKVLDFGLAKAMETAEPKGSAPQAATITTPAMTQLGMILGTAAYMAPEQAKGKFVDRRADIWAFGCVLYEMLTGTRTFVGEDVSDTLVSVLRDDPRWAALPADTPPNVRQLLRRCLQKDPRHRLPHLGVARLELSEAVDTSSSAVPATQRPSWWMSAGLGAVAGAGVVAAVLAFRPLATVAPPAVVQFTVDTLPGSTFTGASSAPRFALSPDGRQLVYQGQNAAGAQLFVRSFDSSESQPLAGTETAVGGSGAQQAFWSPDGRFIAFFDEPNAQLKKLDRTTGLVQAVVDVPGNQLAGSWNEAGTILYASQATAGVRSVSASGGAFTQLTTVDQSNKEGTHLWPSFLPDGRHFVYQAIPVGGEAAIYLGSMDGAAPVRLFASQTGAIVAPPDQLLFGRDGALMSQELDPQQLTLVGEPRIVADQVPATTAGRLAVSASSNGVLAYGSGLGETRSPYETYWVDRAGNRISPAPPAALVGGGVRLSRDGRSLAFARRTDRNGGTTIWVQDTTRGIETRLAALPASASFGAGSPPTFSPDGSRLLFRSFVDGAEALLIQPSSGTTAPIELLRAPIGDVITALDWTQEGHILFARVTGSRASAYFLPSENDRQPVLYLEGLAALSAAFSPDGKWVAYTNGPVSERQVFVQSFPDSTMAKIVASGPGAAHPRWNPQGGELFFVENAQRVMAVKVTTTPRLEVGPPVPLFGLNLGDANSSGAFVSPFDVMPDGNRFVALRRTAAVSDRRLSITVTLNWRHTLR